MFLALVNNQRVEATPRAEGFCPHCKSPVIAKCGRVYVKHWAHKNLEECDKWYEPETKWHYNWKKLFGLDYAERRIIKDGTWHVADILTKDDIVIEFQNSGISTEDIIERESFYGDKMIWVVNGTKFKDNFNTYEKEFEDNWVIHPRYSKLSNQFYVDRTDIKIDIIHDYLRTKGFKAYFVLNNFEGYDSPVFENEIEAYLGFIQGLKELYIHQRIELNFIKAYYKWSRSRKIWKVANRPFFIDFGDENLFWIKSNLGQKEGEGIIVSKEKFLNKYR